MRTPLIFLNELSFPDVGVDGSDIDALVIDLSQTLSAAEKVNSGIVLVTPSGLPSIPVPGPAETLGELCLRSAGSLREHWRNILKMSNTAPFSGAPGLVLGDDCEEFTCAGKSASGLGYAASQNQLALSFNHSRWSEAVIDVDRVWLKEVDDVVEERQEQIEVRNVSTASHVDLHAQHLRTMGLVKPFVGEEVWSERETLFPNLAFLPRVEQQICSLGFGMGLRQVLERLHELQISSEQWDVRKDASPRWQSNVSPEHEARKRFCMFEDLDRKERCFDMHARFQPHQGRIHFRLAGESEIKKLVIAHVGRKLGI
jgi:hypothetical protein